MKVKFNDKGVITELKAEPTIVLGDSLFEVKNEKGEKSQLEEKEKEDPPLYSAPGTPALSPSTAFSGLALKTSYFWS